MAVSVLIVSHDDIGYAFVNAAKTTFDEKLPLPLSVVEVQPDADPDKLTPEIKRLIKQLDKGDGVLILTDLFGSTPSNIAQQTKELGKVCVVTGLNLPMLLRVLNYPDLTLKELADKAHEAGQSGIIKSDDNS